MTYKSTNIGVKINIFIDYSRQSYTKAYWLIFGHKHAKHNSFL